MKQYTNDWAKIATKIIKAAHSRCLLCGTRANDLHWTGVFVRTLEVHHLDHDVENNEISNLLCCCDICHDKLHSSKLTSGRFMKPEEYNNIQRR